MSAKKPAAKLKEKTPSSAAKRKPSADEIRETTKVMDARSSKDRRQDDRRQKDQPVQVERRAVERRVKVNRRRQIDPTTCERDYSPEEVEFMSALDDYKRRSGRMFPTCSEILEVLKALGYDKRVELPTIAQPAETATVVTVTNEQAV